MPIPIPSPPPVGRAAGIGMFFVHTATVETFEGSGAYGDVYAAPIEVPCFIDDSVQLVRGKTAEEVVSSTTVYADPSYASAFAADSRVTVNGRAAFVINANSLTSGPLGLPDHVEVHLT